MTERLQNGNTPEKDSSIINFFKEMYDSLKNFFMETFGLEKKTASDLRSLSTEVSGSNKNKDKHQESSSVDTRGFTPGDYPFKHIKTPYKGIAAYRVDTIKLKPLLGFADLARKGTEGGMTTLRVKDQNLRFSSTKTAGYKKNNPCNVSPYQGDVGRLGSSKVADGQNHGKYASMEDGLASFMRLMRQPRYRNKSIQGINCSGMQGIYEANEPDSLKALRITRITHASEALHVDPLTRLNTDDKETMMAFTQQTAINESGSYFDRATLERAYKKAFG